MKERWVIGGTFEARLSCVRRRRGYNLGAGTKTQMLDDLPPLSRSRQDAQTDVTHIALPDKLGWPATEKCTSAIKER